MAGIDFLVEMYWGPGHDPVKIMGITLGLHQTLTTASGTALMVGVLRALAVIGPDERFGRVDGQMHGPVAKVDFRLAVVEAKRCPRFRPTVVAGIAVGHCVAFGYPVLGEIQGPVLAAISPVQKPAVPVLGQGKLDMKADSG